jgi:hypothetical protein
MDISDFRGNPIMSATFEVKLRRAQAIFIERTLLLAVESMRALLMALNREHARRSSPESEAALATDAAEMAALKHMADSLRAFQKAQGWPAAMDTQDAADGPVAT